MKKLATMKISYRKLKNGKGLFTKTCDRETKNKWMGRWMDDE